MPAWDCQASLDLWPFCRVWTVRKSLAPCGTLTGSPFGRESRCATNHARRCQILRGGILPDDSRRQCITGAGGPPRERPNGLDARAASGCAGAASQAGDLKVRRFALHGVPPPRPTARPDHSGMVARLTRRCGHAYTAVDHHSQRPYADVAQRQSSGFVNLRLGVRIPSSAPCFIPLVFRPRASQLACPL